MKIFTNLDLTDTHRKRLRSIAGRHDIYFADPEASGDGAESAFLESEVAFGSCPPEWLSKAHRLRWLQLDSVGFDRYLHLDWSGALQHITCTNLHGFFAEAVSESVLAGILALYRGIDECARLRLRRLWKKLEIRPRLRLLSDARALLVGYGSIGKRLSFLVGAFGCHVAVYDQARLAGALSTPRELDRALPGIDLVCCALPDTPGTRNLFDRRRIGLLKPGAILVNVGRGTLLDEEALADALESGRLGGAVLDVTREEPLPPDSRLWACPNVILTQHTAGGFSEEVDGKITFFERNLERYLRNEPLESAVDFARGY